MDKPSQDYVILPGGVHVWGPKPEYLGRIPEDLVAQKSAGHTLHLLDTPGWKILESKNVVVTGDVPEVALRTLAVTAEELNKMLINEFGGLPPSSRYSIRVFDKHKDFCNYAGQCGASTALSLYSSNIQEIGVHFGPDADWEDFQTTYAHEFTHAYMDKVFRVTEPLWFAEGMAEYFSQIKWTRSGYQPTGKNWKAMLSLDTDDLLSLGEVLKADRNDMYGLRFPQYYAQAWALVHFLLKKHPEDVEDLLKRRSIVFDLLGKEYITYLKRLRGG